MLLGGILRFLAERLYLILIRSSDPTTKSITYGIYPSAKGGVTSKKISKGRMLRAALVQDAANRCALMANQL